MARVGSYVSPPALVEGQGYRNLVVDPGDVSMVGREVAFLLNGVVAQTTNAYVSGSRHDDFLLAFPPLPTPEPTPTPTPTAAPTEVPDAELSEMIKRVRPAVVRITTGSASGSGVIFETQGQTGYVITNQHVVDSYRHVTVTVNDKTDYRGNVLGTDSVRDLAVVSICCDGFTVLPFGNAAALEVGDEVVAIGYPLGLPGEASVTRGIVSALRYDSAYRSDVIQTDAAINPGNSGGPMLSTSGEILGINTFRHEKTESGRPVEGLGFAVSATTVQAQLATLLASTPVPTPTPTPTVTRDGAHDYGPVSGELRHNPANDFIETEYADVSMADLMVEATFVNPYSASSDSWDYGFILRQDHDDSEAPFIQVVVSSDRYWAVKMGASPPYEEVGGGTIGSFETGDEGQNHLRVIAIGDRGWMFVNGEFIADFDLSSVAGAGDVAAITGAYTGDEVAGTTTRFEEFTVDELNRSYGPADGSLEQEPEHLALHESEVWSRDLVVEAEFVNPKGSDFFYGFVIRNPMLNRIELIGVTDSEWWFHETRDVGDNEYTQLASEYFSKSMAEFKSRNNLMLMAFKDVGWFFVNNKLVSELDLRHNEDAGWISAMGSYFEGDTGSIDFEDFNVWVP